MHHSLYGNVCHTCCGMIDYSWCMKAFTDQYHVLSHTWKRCCSVLDCVIVWAEFEFCAVSGHHVSVRTVFVSVSVCLDTCCSHFLTIMAGVDLHFRHESELPGPGDWTRVTMVLGKAANHYINDATFCVMQDYTLFYACKLPEKTSLIAHGYMTLEQFKAWFNSGPWLYQENTVCTNWSIYITLGVILL